MKIFCANFKILLASILTLSLLAGCAGGKAQNAASTPGATAQPSGSSEEITLRFFWWGGDERHQLTLATLDKYHELNPNIVLEGEYQGMDGYQQKLMTQLAGGTAPDIIQVDQPWLGDIAQGDFLMDLNGNPDFDLTQFEQKILDSFCSVNGKLLGLPSGSNGSIFATNKDFLDRFGISADTKFTWDSFIAEGKRIHEEDPDSYLIAWDPVEAEYFVEEYVRMKTGQPWITDDYEINVSKEVLTEAYAKLSELFTSGTGMPFGEIQPFLSKMDQNPKWINGQLGGYVDWASKTGMWKSSITSPIALLAVPVVDGGVDESLRYRPAHVMSVNNASAHKEESSKFLNWFLNDPEAVSILKDCRSAPTSKVAMELLASQNIVDPDVKAALDRTLANPAAANPYVMGDAEIFSFLMDEFQNIAFGKSTPEQAAETLIARTQEKLDILKTSRG